jgi:hypothetical protein
MKKEIDSVIADKQDDVTPSCSCPVEVSSLKVEALKLAYKLAFEVGHFRAADSYANNRGNIESDINEVFQISDKNFNYLTGRS